MSGRNEEPDLTNSTEVKPITGQPVQIAQSRALHSTVDEPLGRFDLDPFPMERDVIA